MSKLFFRGFGVLFTFLMLLSIPVSVFAQTSLRSGENPTLPPDEVINSDYFAAGNTVNLSGIVNGDAYLAGGNINVDGIINGDLLVAGGNLNLRGRVTGDIRAAGGQLNIGTDIGGNLTALGGNVTVEQGAIVAGSLVSGAGNLLVNAPIGKGATFGGGNVAISNTIGGDINAGVGNLTLNRGAKIAGNLNYWAKQNASLSPEASISGQIIRHEPVEGTTPKPAPPDVASFLAGFFAFWKTVSFISALILGLLLIRFLPNYMDSSSGLIRSNFWKCLLTGFITVIVFPIMLIFLLLTVLGVPAAFVLALIFMLVSYFAKIIISLSIGRKLLQFFNSNASNYWAFTLGIIVYYILSVVPIIGWILEFMLYLAGLGGILILKRNLYVSLNSKKII